MIKHLIVLLLVLLMGRLTYASMPITKWSSSVKVSPSLWNFRDEAELEGLVKLNYNNPRASYYLINQAYQKGYATHIALMYIANARSKGTVEPNSWVSAAYAASIGSGRYAATLHTPDRKELMKVTEYTGFLNSQLDEVIKQAPKSSAVRLMAAICILESARGVRDAQNHLATGRWSKALLWFQTARELDPKWADAHFWSAQAMESYWQDTDRKDGSLLTRAKIALLKAEKLDRNMRGSCAWVLWVVARDRNQLQEQLRYMDIWFKWQPRWAKKPYFRQLRADLINKIAKVT